MGLLGKIWDWVTGRRTPAEEKSASRSAQLRPFLAGGAPGLWASNHLEEIQHVTGWNFCAIRALAKQGSQAELAVYQTRQVPSIKSRRNKADASTNITDKQIKQLLPDSSPICRLLRRPNAEQSKATFIFQIVQQLSATGSALVWSVRNGLGVPRELYVVPTGLATPLPPSSDYPHGCYRVAPMLSFSSPLMDDFQPPGSLGSLLTTGAIIDARSIKPIRWPHPLYLSDGLSPLAAGSMTVDISEQIDRARFYTLKNSSIPGLTFAIDPDINPSPEDREAFRADLRARNAGTANTGKDLILPPGVAATQIERTPQEMDYFNAFNQLRDAVLALHGTPPIAIGVTEAGSYAAFYAALKQYIDLTVQPMLDMIAEELTELLGPPFSEGRWRGADQRQIQLDHGFEIVLKAKTIDDPSLLENRLHTECQAKAMTKNEYRAIRGMAPTKEAWGENLIGDPAPPPPEEGGEEQDPLMALLGGGADGQEDEDETKEDDEEGGDEEGGEAEEKDWPKHPFDNEDADESTTGVKDPVRRGMPNMRKALHDYCAVQVDVPAYLATELRAYTREKVPVGVLTGEDVGSPHITVKYGLYSVNPGKIQSLLRETGPFMVTLGKTSLFRNPDADVLKIEVESETLHELHELLKASFPNVEKHPEYNPHVTLAYIKPGFGKEYTGDDFFAGRTFLVRELSCCDTEGKPVALVLPGERMVPVAAFSSNGHAGKAIKVRPITGGWNEERKRQHPRNPDGSFRDKGVADDIDHGDGEQQQEVKTKKEARSLLARMGGKTLDAFKRMGHAVGHVEHVAKEYIFQKGEENVKKLPRPLQAIARGAWYLLRLGTSAAFATYIAGQKVAEEVSKANGASPEEAAKLRGILACWDILACKPVTLGLAATGFGAIAIPAAFVPLASLTYLVGTGSLAILRQARRGIRAMLHGKPKDSETKSLRLLLKYLDARIQKMEKAAKPAAEKKPTKKGGPHKEWGAKEEQEHPRAQSGQGGGRFTSKGGAKKEAAKPKEAKPAKPVKMTPSQMTEVLGKLQGMTPEPEHLASLAEHLTQMKNDDLKTVMKEHGLKGKTKDKKEDFVNAILAHVKGEKPVEQPAKGKGKPAGGKAAKVKPSLEETKALVKHPTPETLATLADRLSSHTNDELKDVLRHFEQKVSGTKPQLVRRMQELASDLTGMTVKELTKPSTVLELPKGGSELSERVRDMADSHGYDDDTDDTPREQTYENKTAPKKYPVPDFEKMYEERGDDVPPSEIAALVKDALAVGGLHAAYRKELVGCLRSMGSSGRAAFAKELGLKSAGSDSASIAAALEEKQLQTLIEKMPSRIEDNADIQDTLKRIVSDERLDGLSAEGLYERLQTVRGQRDAVVGEIDELDESPDDEEGVQSRLQELNKKLTQLTRARDEIFAALVEQEEQICEIVKSILPKPSQTGFAIIGEWKNGPGMERDESLRDAQTGQITNVLGFLSDVMHRHDGENKQHLKLHVNAGTVARSRCGNNGDGSSTFDTETRLYAGVVPHEIGHAVEHNTPGVRDEAEAFLRHRVKDDFFVNLRKKFGGYKEYEFGRKDNFDRYFDDNSAHYTGKAYTKDGVVRYEDDKIESTEIIAMGLQALLTDPKNFAEKDPEYCGFIIGILTGHLRGSL